MAITDGITANPSSNITHLGVRSNFIKDDGFTYLFDQAIIGNKSKINHVYMIQNFTTEHYIISL